MSIKETLSLPGVARTPSPLAAPSGARFLAKGAAILCRATSASGTDAHLLCWPTVPNAWAALTRSLVPMQTATSRTAAPTMRSSWVHTCSPQLGDLFQDSQAGESTLAALLARTAFQMVVHLVPSGSKEARSPAPWQGLSACLEAYGDVLARERRPPATELLVARDVAIPDERNLTAFHRRHGDLPWLASLPMTMVDDLTSPMPLEASRVAVAAIARFNDAPESNHPIFEAVRPKLANPPMQWRTSLRTKRR